MKNARLQSPGIFYVEDSLQGVSGKEINELLKLAEGSDQKRARVCIHRDVNEKIHEMIIALVNGVYIRPHRHRQKVESYAILKGRADLVVFTDDGKIEAVVAMGDMASDFCFFNRVPVGKYHGFVMLSESLIFKETTNGPFDHKETEYAPWAPDATDKPAVAKFAQQLRKDAAAWHAR